MHYQRLIQHVSFLPALICGAFLLHPESIQAQDKPKSALTVWDTVQTPVELTPAALAGKNSWKIIPADKAADSFWGDAVVSNGRIAVVLRKGDSAVDVHAVKPDGVPPRLRLRLQTAAGEPADRLERVSLVENTKGAACLDATFKTAKGASLAARFRLKRGEVSVQTEPGAGAGKLRVETPGRFVVLPDFFADDIALDAHKLPVTAVDLPSENFVLQPTADGDAIALSIFESRQQDVKATLAGAGAQCRFTGSEISFEGKKIWVALLDARRIWHAHDVQKTDAGKVIPLDWNMPFPAQWRVNFARADGLTDSWEMLLQEKKGGPYVKHSWMGAGSDSIPASRQRWNTVLGNYSYPCWSDPAGKGWLQPLKNKALTFAGPTLLYPIHRVKETPLDAFTVVDAMRSTLGVGPCQHLLDVEGQKVEYLGIPTCEAYDRLTAIYEKKQQKAKRGEIDEILNDALTFVKHIRGRITRYVEFSHQMRDYLAKEKQAHPELKEFISEMQKLNAEIDRRAARRAPDIRTPEYVVKLNEDFRKNVLDNEGASALKRCTTYADSLVEIGDNQDELAGECRWAIRAMRQRASILMALDARVAPVALEIRKRTQEVLRNPAHHEGARH
jgi:hypothetical protein